MALILLDHSRARSAGIQGRKRTRGDFGVSRSGDWETMGGPDDKNENETSTNEAALPSEAAAPGEAAAAPKRPIRSINSLGSFDTATTEPREVAGLYFYLQLDCLVDLAYRVACDFFRRPQLYTDLGVTDRGVPEIAPDGSVLTIAPDLAKLAARYGSDEQIPSQDQRDAIFLPIFGQAGMISGDDQSQFSRGRDGLVNAATAFSERVFDTGEGMLRERVRAFHRTFKAWLTRLDGDSLHWSKGQALVGVTEKLAYKILRNKGVAAVFGINTPPSEAWPYTEDSFGDLLMEEISKQLVENTNSYVAITREGISNRQRAALRGAEALATIIDFDEGGPNSELDLLITKCYTWGSALMSLPGPPVGWQGGQPVEEPTYKDRPTAVRNPSVLFPPKGAP
jgi:hypothetical protein